MPNEAIVKIINLILAPVVMITACGIMLNGLMGRYTWLTDRVRSVHQERLSLLDLDLSQHQSKRERLPHVEHVLADLLNHHHQVHDVLVLTYLSILFFMLDMLVIALTISNDIMWLHQLVLIVFLIGVGILFVGMALIAYELRTSHYSVQLEVNQNCRLCQKAHRH